MLTEEQKIKSLTRRRNLSLVVMTVAILVAITFGERLPDGWDYKLLTLSVILVAMVFFLRVVVISLAVTDMEKDLNKRRQAETQAWHQYQIDQKRKEREAHWDDMIAYWKIQFPGRYEKWPARQEDHQYRRYMSGEEDVWIDQFGHMKSSHIPVEERWKP